MPKSKARWAIIVLSGFVLLIVFFYAEEDWRGWRAWQNCERELEAQGAVLNWNAYFPPPVPDDENFFKAPMMTAWFVRGQPKTDFSDRLQNTNTDAVITTPAAAKNYLDWSGQFQPQFDQIREALKRPYTQMDGDYSKPFGIPIPNFVSVRALARVLAQRAKCYLLLGQPEKALGELTLLNDSRRIEEREPTGKPMTLVDAMINVAVTGLYVNTIADGLQKHAWQEPQLKMLEAQLAEINLIPLVAQSFKTEMAASCHTLEITSLKVNMFMFSGSNPSIGQRVQQLKNNLESNLIPRGWVYQNMALIARLEQEQTEGFDPINNLVLPQQFRNLQRKMNRNIFHGHARPYNFLAAMMMPNSTKATETLAYNQTLVNEAQIACALERCRLSYDRYPSTLEALSPEFIKKLPHDIIGGQPLNYRLINNEKFLLYSVGWNETDEGGTGSGKIDQADWVWKN